MKRKAKKLTPKQIHFLQNYFLSGSIEELAERPECHASYIMNGSPNQSLKRHLKIVDRITLIL